MFYQPGITPHNLPFDPFKACVVPRPIGWISTVSATHRTPIINPATTTTASSSEPANTNGTPTTSTTSNPSSPTEPTANLAPYSQFQNLTFDPPYIMFASNQTPSNTQKDSVRNAEVTGIFCWQLATYPLRDAVNITSEQLPYGVDEFTAANLERTYSTTLKPRVDIPGFKGVPMVKDSPVRFECEYHSTLRLPGNPPWGSVDVVIGRVVGVYIDERVIDERGRVDVAKTLPIARCGYYEYAVVRETFEMKMPGSQAMRDGLEGRMKGMQVGDGDGEKVEGEEGMGVVEKVEGRRTEA